MAVGTFNYTHTRAQFIVMTGQTARDAAMDLLEDIRQFSLGGLLEGNFASTTRIPVALISSGIPGGKIALATITDANINPGQLTGASLADRTITEAKLDRTSVRLFDSGAAGKITIKGSADFSIPTTATSQLLTVDLQATCDEVPSAFPTTNLRCIGLTIIAADPGVMFNANMALTSYPPTGLIRVETQAAPASTWSGSVHWIVEGTA